eukprot:1704606-Pyramimonas_sp.AAC.1
MLQQVIGSDQRLQQVQEQEEIPTQPALLAGGLQALRLPAAAEDRGGGVVLGVLSGSVGVVALALRLPPLS